MKSNFSRNFLLILLTQLVVLTRANHYDVCDCFHYSAGTICPGSTFQWENQGKHGYCKEKGTDSEGKCKCFNCDSCYLVNSFDF